MNRKIIGILIIIIGIIALAGIIYFMFFFDFPVKSIDEIKEEEKKETSAQTQEKTSESTSKRAVINIDEKPRVEKVSENDLRQMAMSFAERLGSYSNQSNYGNIRDLKIFMSSKMKSWADNYIKEEMVKKIDYSIYYGLTTKSVSAKVKKFDDDLGRAEILINTQRRMATGTMNNVVSFQEDVTIYYVKERGAWKVDSAEWEGVE